MHQKTVRVTMFETNSVCRIAPNLLANPIMPLKSDRGVTGRVNEILAPIGHVHVSIQGDEHSIAFKSKLSSLPHPRYVVPKMTGTVN